MPHLENDLRQKRKIGRHGSERARQRSDVPKRQHYGRHKDDERQDYNTDTPFEFCHSQENNKVLTEAQVCYTHVAEEERNKQNRMSEGGDNLKVTQKALIWSLIVDNKTWNAINSMNSMKSSFALKRIGRREPSCSVGRGNFVSVITYKMR